MHWFRPLALLLVAGLLLAAPAAHGASSSGVVVSQVFAGGGNSGAAFTNDFVELYNSGSTAADVSTWSIQYAPATSASWQVTPLTGSIQPGHHYLVQLASAAAVGAGLPAPDATGTSNLAVSRGKVALVRSATALTCGATPGSCSAVALVDDLVGYGSASDFEGSDTAPALSSTTAAMRAGGGCVDTDSNSADFSAEPPAPRNSASAVTACGTTPPPSQGSSQNAVVDVDIQPALSIALERPTLSFGAAVAGETPTPIPEHVTVTSDNAAGYALTVKRSAFVPADLPLGIAGSAPSGAQIGPALAGGATAAIPVAPAADLVVGTSAARSGSGGDVWSTSIGFTGPLPAVAPGRYTSTVTYTVIGR